MSPLAIVLVVFFFLFFLRVPIAVVLIASSLVGLWLAPTEIKFSTISTTMWQGINHFVLMAIPFFILMATSPSRAGSPSGSPTSPRRSSGTSQGGWPTSASS